MKVKVRFAPSPTGPLHIGGARTVLFNWLFARQNQGELLLRSEDTDLERSHVKWEQVIGDSLRWLGLDWDEGLDVGGKLGPYRQTERLDYYKDYLSKLWLGGHVYYCFCTPQELEARREESQAEHGGYDGRCRDLTQVQIQTKLDSGLQPAIRFRVPANRNITFQDRIRGEVTVNTADVSDFVIIKNDGIPTYNYAVVIDDLAMEVSHVIRANEHLTNTPRQILIYEALSEPIPQFAHVSLIMDETGRKMSKRMGDMSVDAYMRRGYLPEAVVNFLALLGWSPEEPREFFDLSELVEAFSMERISKSPAIFDFQKLDWMNNQYILKADLDRLADLSLPLLAMAGIDTATLDRGWLKLVIEVVRDELMNMSQLSRFVQEFLARTVPMEAEALTHLQAPTAPLVLDEFVCRLEALAEITQESVSLLLKTLNKELKQSSGVSGKAVFMPIRAALSGSTQGQELYHLIPILGQELSLHRIEGARSQAGI